jgi:tRNA dimethylallyltransferase
MKKNVFCLMGPTAIGKTDLACLLTDNLPLEIVNVDSSLIYQELNIGAAKPEKEVLLRYPHHLINRCNLEEVYSVAQFCDEAKFICEDILTRGNYPLLVGGTMMYFNAFQQGLAKLPEASAEIREKILAQAHELGWLKMHEQLISFDPITAARVHPNDQQRMLRAFEIYLQSGKPWSVWLTQAHEKNDFEFHHLALFPEPRSWLHQRIHQRFELMLKEGFIEEVKGIFANPEISPLHPALRSVGYRQAIMYLQGELNEDIWVEKAITATRQLAKRQMTWLRSFETRIDFFQPNPRILQEIVACIQKILDNN